MVATSSTTAQASENEKRMRKSTIEKVKANHLSRQLQMRLQYARLKVEHGWQKQNLNEVENLYFHNSHLRAPKPFPAPAIATTQQQHTSFNVPHQSGSTQSSLSFKLGASSLVRNSMAASSLSGNEQSRNIDAQDGLTSNHASQGEPIVVDDSDSTSNIDPLLRSTGPSDLQSAAPSITEGVPLLVTSIGSAPFMPNNSLEDNNLTSEDLAISSPNSPNEGLSPSDPTKSSTNHYPSIKPTRPRASKGQSSSSRAVQSSSLTAKDMFNFSLASTLTYDSFWSSHSGSNAPRPLRGSFSGNATDNSPAFSIPGDFTSRIQEHGNSNAIFPSSPKTTSGSAQLETTRSLGDTT